LPVGTAVAYAAVGGVRVRFNGLISALPVGTKRDRVATREILRVSMA